MAAGPRGDAFWQSLKVLIKRHFVSDFNQFLIDAFGQLYFQPEFSMQLTLFISLKVTDVSADWVCPTEVRKTPQLIPSEMFSGRKMSAALCHDLRHFGSRSGTKSNEGFQMG